MMEKPGEIRKIPVQWTHSDTATERDEEASVASTTLTSDVEYEETSALLQDPNALAPAPGYRSISNSDEDLPVPDQRNDTQETSQNVYWLMLRRLPVTTALIADVLFAIIIASFEATLPIHIKDVFGWKTLQAGLLFLLIQFPALVLLAPAGWLKDRIGMRMPVTIGFLLFAPSLWLLGVPGSGGFEWANHGNVGQIIFMGSLLSIGVWRVLLLGFGAVEVMNGANELEAEHPGVFGPNGGNSRAFSMTNISWKSGMLLGPLISGALTESVGYYYMNLIFGILCFLMGISTFLVLRKR